MKNKKRKKIETYLGLNDDTCRLLKEIKSDDALGGCDVTCVSHVLTVSLVIKTWRLCHVTHISA